MSKLWVYGDSWANSEHDLRDKRSQSWPYRLSTHFDEFESHARWGIGNDWIMEKFVENNPYTKGRSDRDIGIFYFSHPRRMRLPIQEGVEWLQSHTLTNENWKGRGSYAVTIKDYQHRLRKNGWIRQVQEQVVWDQWRWRRDIEQQLHVLNTYSKYFSMLIVHSGFGDVGEIATKSNVFDKELKSSEGFCWLDVMPLGTHPGIQEHLPDDPLVKWVNAPLEKAPCHMSPAMNLEYYKLMLAACTTHDIKPHLKNGWVSWSDCAFNRNDSRSNNEQ